MIEQCPECNKTLEFDRQIFCDVCGFDLRTAHDAAQQPAGDDDSLFNDPEDAESLAAAGLLDPETPKQSDYSHLDAEARRQVYLDKLKEAWADGTITPEEMQELTALRSSLALSEAEAEELSQKAIESLRPAKRDELDGPPETTASHGLMLSVNGNSFFMENFRGILDMQLENFSDLDFDSVKIEVSGDLLGRTEQCTCTLKPCKTFKKKFTAKPEDPGVNLVKFRVTARCGDEIFAFWAEEDFPVFRETKDLQQISIQAESLINNSVGENSKSMGNVVKSQIGSLFNFDKIKDANDLMQEFRNLPPQYKTVELEYDPQRSEQLKASMTTAAVKGKRIVHAERGSLTQTASLSIAEKTSRLNMVLIAKPCVAMGKKSDNDIVTRFCPRNPINDARTNRISRKHCVLELKDGQLWITDPGSPNGTAFAGSKIEQDGVKYKRQGKELELGGALVFRVDCVANVQKVDWRQYVPLMNPDAEPLWDNAFNPHLNAVRLRRLNNLGQDDPHGKEGYVLVYRVATLGAAPDCALCCEDKGLEPVHAGFVYMNGRFYLENLTELTDVFVNEVTISKNELIPLSFGDHILIARLRLQFEQRYQLFINV